MDAFITLRMQMNAVYTINNARYIIST